MTKEDIASRFIKNDSPFNKIHVIQQRFNIIPAEYGGIDWTVVSLKLGRNLQSVTI